MKTKTWLALLLILLAVSLGLSAWLFRGEAATQARVISDGQLVKTVCLTVDQTFTVTSANGGTNVVTIRDGAIAVTQASCPDHHCMHRGFCSGGGSIVCLPNRLVIEFVGSQDVDMVAG